MQGKLTIYNNKEDSILNSWKRQIHIPAIIPGSSRFLSAHEEHQKQFLYY